MFSGVKEKWREFNILVEIAFAKLRNMVDWLREDQRDKLGSSGKLALEVPIRADLAVGEGY